MNAAFAIVKAARRESLGIIKKTETCSVKISTKIKEIFTFKHFGKIILYERENYQQARKNLLLYNFPEVL